MFWLLLELKDVVSYNATDHLTAGLLRLQGLWKEVEGWAASIDYFNVIYELRFVSFFFFHFTGELIQPGRRPSLMARALSFFFYLRPSNEFDERSLTLCEGPLSTSPPEKIKR